MTSPKNRDHVSDAALRAALDADCAAKSIVTSRGGMISRKHYASRLGCGHQYLGFKLAATFAEYEAKLKIVTGPLKFLPEMRQWLDAAYEARELEVRDGKVDRSAFMSRFDLKSSAFMVRHPEIRALFEALDAKVQTDGYLPATRQNVIDRVRAALAAEPALNKDRITINLVKLAHAIDLPKDRFFVEPFAGMVAVRQSEISTRVMASKIDPFLLGRVFPFSDLAPSWPTAFLRRVGVRFKQAASRLAAESLKKPYLELRNALEWIGSSADPNCRAVVAEAKGGRIVDANAWEDALFGYRANLVSSIAMSTGTDASVDGAITSLRTMLDALSSGGVIPSISMPLPGVKHASRRSGHLRSVAEAAPSNMGGDTADYVAFARDRYLEACATTSTDMGKGDSEEFIGGLAHELRLQPNLPVDPAEAVRMVLRRRLDAIQVHAAAIVEKAMETHQRGQRLLSASNIDGSQFEHDYLKETTTYLRRAQVVRRLFPDPKRSDSEEVERGIGNLLAFIEQRHAGVPPVQAEEARGPLGQFLGKRYLEYGGLATLAPMLSPDPDTIGSILTLYLCESGANLSVGRTLDRDCMEQSDLSGHRRITGHKARAKGKPIIVDIPSDSPVVRAIDWLLAAGARLPANAGDDADRLFLMRIGSRVQLMTPHWFTNWFKGFAASIPGFENLKLLPNMIRPSVLLHAALGNDGRLRTGLAIGQHGIAVSQGYQQKWPTRLLYDANVRRFQEAFETLVLASVEDAAGRLGITVEEFDGRLNNLRATGLGTFCKDAGGRHGQEQHACSTLDCWNDCPHLLIVAEVDAVASLLVWQGSLRAAQPEWERDQPERWDTVWLPWLCLTDVVEEKMKRGPLLKVWNAACKRAAEVAARPEFVPPRPW